MPFQLQTKTKIKTETQNTNHVKNQRMQTIGF